MEKLLWNENNGDDLCWEHKQHTSEDWDTLSDKCSECYKEKMNWRSHHTKPEYTQRSLDMMEDNHIMSHNDYFN